MTPTGLLGHLPEAQLGPRPAEAVALPALVAGNVESAEGRGTVHVIRVPHNWRRLDGEGAAVVPSAAVEVAEAAATGGRAEISDMPGDLDGEPSGR